MSSGSTGGRGDDAKTIISLNTSFGDIIMLYKPITVLLLLFIFFIHLKKYVNCSICTFTLYITTNNVQTLCWSKTSPSFSGAHSSCISRSINTIFVPQIAMYIRINMLKTDFIYLMIWCDSMSRH